MRLISRYEDCRAVILSKSGICALKLAPEVREWGCPHRNEKVVGDVLQTFRKDRLGKVRREESLALAAPAG
jgi:hypothetical protein